MKLDKNSVIGFVLLALLFFGYFYFTRQGQIELEKKQKQVQDSLARLVPAKDTTVVIGSLNQSDSVKIPIAVAGQFTQNGSGNEELKVIETELIKITFTNKGPAQNRRTEKI
jgi:YidC/Oxa1 family membrane protein insertase